MSSRMFSGTSGRTIFYKKARYFTTLNPDNTSYILNSMDFFKINLNLVIPKYISLINNFFYGP